MARASWWDEAAQDLRFAIRSLRRQPGFTAAAILTLAFGIGATTAILSVVDGVLVRPLPYPNAERAVLLWSSRNGGTAPFSAPNYFDIKSQAQSLERVTAFRNWTFTLLEDGQAELVSGSRVASGLFESLGVRPALGRTFRSEDEAVGSEPVALIGDALWRRRFGADRAIVGRQIELNAQKYTVVGVMPPGFAFPRGAELPAGFQFGPRTEIWTPLIFSQIELQLRGLQNLAVLGVIKPGVEPGTARADLDVIARRLEEQFPQVNTRVGIRLIPMIESAVAPVRPALLVLLGAVAFLLLIACVNVSNLLLTRTAARSREVALRGALGASAPRLARQFITENLLLAIAGGALGVVLAGIGKGALLAFAPAGLPRVDDVALDWRILGGILAVVMVVGVGFGLLVSSEAIGGDRAEALREGSRGSGGVGRRRLRNGLVVLEVAVSVVLLAGAGVLARTFQNLRRIEPGFRADSVLVAQLNLPLRSSDFSQFPRLSAAWRRFYYNVLEPLGQRPGVRAAAVVTMVPLTGGIESTGFSIDGKPPAPPDNPYTALFVGASDDYFAVMGIPLVRGRTFGAAERDSTATGIVISEAMAKKYWPGEDPVGQRIRGIFRPFFEVIGVVKDIRHRDLGSPPEPVIYLPISIYSSPSMSLVVRTAADPMSELATVRSVIRAVDPAVPVTDPRPLEAVLAGAVAQQRFSATLIGGFAVAALALAMLGLYGVISFGVARRTRELGVRLALGAAPGSLMAMVVKEGVVLSLIGVGIGLAGAVALSRVLGRLVFEVSPSDPVTLGLASLLLVAVALVASLAPARRATRIDLVTALREE